MDETLKKEFREVKRVFALALKKNIITENFFIGEEPITRPKSFKTSIKVDALSRKEEYLLTNYLKHNWSQYKNIILLALYTRYENWRNIDLNAKGHTMG